MDERSVHGVTWKDKLAWMENMKGDDWNTFLHSEQNRWKHFVQDKSLARIRSQIENSSKIGRQLRFTASGIEIGHVGTMAYQWRWVNKQEPKHVSDICVKGNVYVSYEDSTVKGAENYCIAAYGYGSYEPLWIKKGMSPYVGVIGDRCYSIEAKNKLVYYKCVSWIASSGEDVRTEYEEKDARYNLELIRGSNCLFLRRQSGPKQDVIQFDSEGGRLLEPISLESSRFILGGRDEYLHWNKEWKVSYGLGKSKFLFPPFHVNVPESIDTVRKILVTRWYGKRTIWRLSEGSPQILWRGVGNVLIDPWDGDWVRLTCPGEILWNKIGNLRKARQHVKEYFVNGVPFYMIQSTHTRHIKGLFIAAYSAYGIPSSFSTARWTPLLAEGWAICFPIFPGGGDHTPEWEDAGRLGGRLEVLHRAEVVVKEARRICDVPASKTVIYGRSAGGLWVGGLCARHPTGDLFGGAYMEVPYLDVLRTTTNHSLPLTYLETDEFGLPALRLSDFAGQLRWSPMETLGEKGTPGLFQIVRTGLNDSQVFAYESAKWIVRSRGLETNKTQNRVYLAIEGDQGHFVHGKTGLNQQAEDISSIFTLIKNQRNEYRMPASRNNRKTERKNRKDRKERKNRKETRKNRKNRKGTRKNRK